jgi:E3 ubiquitin-protein ligase MARCH6
MIFVLDTAIGLCIWIPFTVGKTMALLSVCVHDQVT